MNNLHESETADARIAVAIPCYNEALAIAIVIEHFRAALPGAELVVFDNNSTDGTGAIARELGVRVVDVPEQGKGQVVRAAFASLRDADVVLLTDGDGTYAADAAPLLIAAVRDGAADMAVGARRPTPGAGAMTLTRALGNLLFRLAFWALIGPGTRDLLSGYRAFNRHFRERVELRAIGFEIETELASEAVARGLKVKEIDTPYFARIAGTESKLRSVRDGWRILATIVGQSFRYRPHRAVVVFALPFAVLALAVDRRFLGAELVSIAVFCGLLVIDAHFRPARRNARHVL